VGPGCEEAEAGEDDERCRAEEERGTPQELEPDVRFALEVGRGPAADGVDDEQEDDRDEVDEAFHRDRGEGRRKGEAGPPGEDRRPDDLPGPGREKDGRGEPYAGRREGLALGDALDVVEKPRPPPRTEREIEECDRQSEREPARVGGRERSCQLSQVEVAEEEPEQEGRQPQ
jgi:hypothetical protein